MAGLCLQTLVARCCKVVRWRWGRGPDEWRPVRCGSEESEMGLSGRRTSARSPRPLNMPHCIITCFFCRFGGRFLALSSPLLCFRRSLRS